MRSTQNLDLLMSVLPAFMLMINCACYYTATDHQLLSPQVDKHAHTHQFECEVSNWVRNLLSHIS